MPDLITLLTLAPFVAMPVLCLIAAYQHKRALDHRRAVRARVRWIGQQERARRVHDWS